MKDVWNGRSGGCGIICNRIVSIRGQTLQFLTENFRQSIFLLSRENFRHQNFLSLQKHLRKFSISKLFILENVPYAVICTENFRQLFQTYCSLKAEQ